MHSENQALHSTSETLGKPPSITKTPAPEQKDSKKPSIPTSVTGHSLEKRQQEKTFSDKEVIHSLTFFNKEESLIIVLSFLWTFACTLSIQNTERFAKTYS